MSRTEATSIIAQLRLRKLEPAKREAMLLDWWPIDAGDPEYGSLSAALRDELARSDGPEHSSLDHRYDELLHIALKADLRGVKDSYLEACLRRDGVGEFQVFGPSEVLEVCPCCRFRTILERNSYEVCPVCFWEDDGTIEGDRYSNANHMTLRDARTNFARIGAVSESALPYIAADGTERYYPE
jgi:hypothetical protein